jgi:hypothetical protein
MHEPYFEGCVPGQQTSDDRSFPLEGHERRQNQSAHCSKSSVLFRDWADRLVEIVPVVSDEGVRN